MPTQSQDNAIPTNNDAEQAKKQENPATYRVPQKVWTWKCDAPPTSRKPECDTPIEQQASKTPPSSCKNCGGDAFRKTGENIKYVTPTPKTGPEPDVATGYNIKRDIDVEL